MRIGVIGTGSMGANHLRVVHSIPELTLTCGVDASETNLLNACAPYNITTDTDYRRVTDMVDAVMISTPTIHHYEIARFFLEQGKHVLLEKPVTETIAQADHLIRLAKEKNLTLAVGHLERFNPAVEYIQPLVKRPLFIEVQRLGSFSPRSLDVDVIMDLMIHDLDIILQWDNSGVHSFNASGINIVSGKIDIANVRLEFNSRLVCNITASRVSQRKTRKLRIFQKNNYISLDYKKRRVKIFSLTQGNLVEEAPEIPEVEPLWNLWMNFYKTVATGVNYNVTGEDGRQALELAIRLAEHIRQNMMDIHGDVQRGDS